LRHGLEDGFRDRGDFGVSDNALPSHVAGFASREEILAYSNVVVLPKPQHSDLVAMHAGQVLWGWPHCVQDTEMTQLAIDRELTLIAFEAMNHWTADGHVGSTSSTRTTNSRATARCFRRWSSSGSRVSTDAG
jgi:hypothetical protein